MAQAFRALVRTLLQNAFDDHGANKTDGDSRNLKIVILDAFTTRFFRALLAHHPNPKLMHNVNGLAVGYSALNAAPMLLLLKASGTESVSYARCLRGRKADDILRTALSCALLGNDEPPVCSPVFVSAKAPAPVSAIVDVDADSDVPASVLAQLRDFL
jgi:hypothetical protein